MLNPLRSEGEAFRFLLYVLAVAVAVVAVVLIARAVLWCAQPRRPRLRHTGRRWNGRSSPA